MKNHPDFQPQQSVIRSAVQPIARAALVIATLAGGCASQARSVVEAQNQNVPAAAEPPPKPGKAPERLLEEEFARALAFEKEGDSIFRKLNLDEAATLYRKIRATLDANEGKPFDIHDLAILAIEYALLTNTLRPVHAATEKYSHAIIIIEDLGRYYEQQGDESNAQKMLNYMRSIVKKLENMNAAIEKAGIAELPDIESLESVDPLQD